MLPELNHEVLRISPSGISCVFVPINDELGMKLYRNEENRNDAYSRQAFYSTIDMAPLVYDCGSVLINGNEYWYYITERIQTYMDVIHDYKKAQEHIRNAFNVEAEHQEYSQIHYDAPELYDLHSNNIGYCKRLEKYVVLDFGND